MNDIPARPRHVGSQSSGHHAPDTPTAEVVKRRPPKVVTVVDELDRRITVKFLSALDRMRLAKVLGSKEATNEVYMGYAALAFAVTKVDDEDVATNTIREIEFMVERLGDEGLAAVGQAYRDHFKDLMPKADADGVEEAKN